MALRREHPHREHDAPELRGRCKAEKALARIARRRLAALLEGPPAILRRGRDRYGRTLARVSVGGRDVGEMLIAEGLAEPWRGRMAAWCQA